MAAPIMVPGGANKADYSLENIHEIRRNWTIYLPGSFKELDADERGKERFRTVFL
jgi:hypothetical protein